MFRSLLGSFFTVPLFAIRRTMKISPTSFSLLDLIKKKLPTVGKKAKKEGGKVEDEEQTKCISIFRFNPDTDDKPYMQNYEIELSEMRKHPLTLDALEYIRTEIDPSLSYRRSCREGICGSCAMNINGLNHLACTLPIPRGDIKIYPLPHMFVVKDLVVDLDNFYAQYGRIEPYLQRKCNEAIGKRQLLQSIRDQAKLSTVTKCILCACCSAACPVYWWNGNEKLEEGFLGPAALIQAYRWIVDSRDEKHCERLKKLNGTFTFKCHTITNCTQTCPKGLNPARAISDLKRMIAGLSDKEFPDMKNDPVFENDPSEFDPNKRAAPVEVAKKK